MSVEDVPEFIQKKFEIHEWKYAFTILIGRFDRVIFNIKSGFKFESVF